jgi:hypothetical protein
LQNGFSLQDIERIDKEDVRSINALIKEIEKQEEIKNLKLKLLIAESFNFAYVGSKPDKTKGNQSEYKRWIRNIETKIAKLQKQKIDTIWETIKKSGRF